MKVSTWQARRLRAGRSIRSIDRSEHARCADRQGPAQRGHSPRAQRSLARVGVIDQVDGGFPATSTHYLNGAFVEPLLAQMNGPLVSRWGHILVRRALASRLDTPVGMNGADWAALRAGLLLRMGEADAARAMVQSVDSGFFTPGLEDAAMGSFMATADPIGLCPVTALTASGRPGWNWDLARAICSAYTGDGPPAMAQLDRLIRRGGGARIDVLLAEKFAGAATATRRAVTIDWKDVDGLTPWNTGLAFATGIEPPQDLREKAWADYAVLAVRAPMLPLATRCAAADVAGGAASCRARPWSISTARLPPSMRRTGRFRTRPGARSPRSCARPMWRQMPGTGWPRSRRCGARPTTPRRPIRVSCSRPMPPRGWCPARTWRAMRAR
jgi:hypothetical protein